MGKEKLFETSVKKFLDAEGVWYVKFFANAFTKAGIPDILGCANGRFLAVELKAENGKPSPLQIRNLNLIDDAGGYAILLYPDMFDDFKMLIKELNLDHECTAIEVYKKMKGRWKDAGQS